MNYINDFFFIVHIQPQMKRHQRMYRNLAMFHPVIQIIILKQFYLIVAIDLLNAMNYRLHRQQEAVVMVVQLGLH